MTSDTVPTATPDPRTPSSNAWQGSPAPVSTFYRVDSSRNTFAELWRDVRSPAVVLVWLTKLLRVKLPGSVNDANVASLEPFEVHPEALPADVRARLAPGVEQLRPLGFEPVAWYAVIDLFHSSRLYFVLLGHASGTAIARIAYRAEGAAAAPKRHFHAEFITELSDGRFMWSTSARAYLDPPASCVLNPQPGMEPPLLWANHRQQLDVLRVDRRVTVAAGGATDPRELIERHHALVRDERLRRRVFAPMSRDDLERAAAADAFRAGAEAGQLRHPDVLAELDKLQNRRSSWGAAILILVVSLGLFVGAGSRSWLKDREFLLVVVGILFFHELGHYLAMRLFRYRNLKMFFIPMLGAAVSGQHYNVPGWKKVIVALAGPVPGIAAGVALGVAGVVNDYDPLMLKTAVVALILNGLNLLPVLPLDGGHVVHSMFFSRHPLLDVAFRVAAAAVLILVNLRLGDRVLMILGVLMLISVPAAYRTARVARELRLSGLPTASPDSQTVPTDVAQVITDRVQAAFPKRTGNKMLARHVLSVYETVNARPPGILATLCFGTVHVAALLVAVVGAAVFVLAQQPGGLSRANLERMARAADRTAREPQIAFDPAALRTAGVAPAAGAAGDLPLRPRFAHPEEASPQPRHRVLVAHFDACPSAEAAFDSAAARLPVDAGLLLFGQTVLLALPPAIGDDVRRQWFGEFESQTRRVFVDADGAPPLRLRCAAPSEAAAVEIERELAGYLHVPLQTESLMPPWHPGDPRTPAERQGHHAARRTYVRLQEAMSTIFGDDADPKLTRLGKEMRDASRRGEQDKLKELQARHEKLVTDKREKAIATVRAEPGTDRRVIDHFVSDFEVTPGSYDPKRFEERERRLARLLGQVPLPRGATQPTLGAARFSGAGNVKREGATLNFLYLSFTDPFSGAPAFARWLASRGCTDFKYTLERLDFADVFEQMEQQEGD